MSETTQPTRSSVFATWLQTRDRYFKVAIVAFFDVLVLGFSVCVAYALRTSSFSLPPWSLAHLYFMAPPLGVVAAGLIGVYQASARTYSNSIEVAILAANTVAILAWALILLYFGATGFPRSILIIHLLLAVTLMVGLRRFAARVFSAYSLRPLPRKEQVPVVIYGADRNGLALLDAIWKQGRYRVVAFLDSDYTLVDRTVGGLKVYPLEGIDSVLTRFSPREAIIAKPPQNRSMRRVLVDRLLDKGLAVKTIPVLDDVVDGKINISEIRDIRLEDLLGRDPVPPDRQLMEKAIKNQVVMVTGAGGSIGSELVRQVVRYQPKGLVLLDNNEFALFQIRREIENHKASSEGLPVEVIACLVDVQNKSEVQAVIAKWDIEIVFHAAAYKHVRMVQENVDAGIRNNVVGTKNVAEAAVSCGVKRFVLVSTDKAVRPTSVMGASKRVAEMVIQTLAAEPGQKTIFSIVRFGNVLGSTGSVVPIFREQIAAGGPVQVTHPDVTRYFMLIPEAAQLVIQAGAMAEGGEVFVLDMGESVRILQLAETMIELAGFTHKSESNPDGDIEIVFTGLTDGEKLFEELQIGNDVTSTSHTRIMKSREYSPDRAVLQKTVQGFLTGKDESKVGEALVKFAHLNG